MIADVKKQWTDINLDLVTIIRNPTLRAFAAEIDRYTLSPFCMCRRMTDILQISRPNWTAPRSKWRKQRYTSGATILTRRFRSQQGASGYLSLRQATAITVTYIFLDRSNRLLGSVYHRRHTFTPRN